MQNIDVFFVTYWKLHAKFHKNLSVFMGDMAAVKILKTPYAL